eukprot:SAG11_NODE_295_length_11115_cov_14.005264_4_plen_103_part_00
MIRACLHYRTITPQYYFQLGLCTSDLPSDHNGSPSAQSNAWRAIGFFTLSIELCATHPGPWHLRGKPRLELGQRAAGLEDVERALALGAPASAISEIKKIWH